MSTRDLKLAGRSAHSAKKCEVQHPKQRTLLPYIREWTEATLVVVKLVMDATATR